MLLNGARQVMRVVRGGTARSAARAAWQLGLASEVRALLRVGAHRGVVACRALAVGAGFFSIFLDDVPDAITLAAHADAGRGRTDRPPPAEARKRRPRASERRPRRSLRKARAARTPARRGKDDGKGGAADDEADGDAPRAVARAGSRAMADVAHAIGHVRRVGCSTSACGAGRSDRDAQRERGRGDELRDGDEPPADGEASEAVQAGDRRRGVRRRRRVRAPPTTMMRLRIPKVATPTCWQRARQARSRWSRRRYAPLRASDRLAQPRDRRGRRAAVRRAARRVRRGAAWPRPAPGGGQRRAVRGRRA